MDRPPAHTGLPAGGVRPLLRRLRGRIRHRPRSLHGRSRIRKPHQAECASVCADDRHTHPPHRGRDYPWRILPQADRQNTSAADILVNSPPGGVLLLLCPHQSVVGQPDGRHLALYSRQSLEQDMADGVQLQFRHRAALVSLYARGALSHHAYTQSVARKSIQARCGARAENMAFHPAHTLHQAHRSQRGI